MEVEVKIMTNNIIFKCELDQKYYNVKHKKSYALLQLFEVVPTSPQTFQPNIKSIIICEDCWKENQESELKLEEPSNIVFPRNPKTIIKP